MVAPPTATAHSHSISHWYVQAPIRRSVSSRYGIVHDGDREVLQPEHELRLPRHWLLPSVSLKQTRQRVMKPAVCRDTTFERIVVTCESVVFILDDMSAMAASSCDCSVFICSCKVSFSDSTCCSRDSAESRRDFKSATVLGSDSSASILLSSSSSSRSDDSVKLSYNHRPHHFPFRFQITHSDTLVFFATLFNFTSSHH